MNEGDVKARIRLALGKHARHARLFLDPVGQGWLGQVVGHAGATLTLARPRRVTFGLAPGSADMIGWTTITVTPDMVGKRIAVFTSAEVKPGAGGVVMTDQENWSKAVAEAGGFADIVRSEADALRLVRA